MVHLQWRHCSDVRVKGFHSGNLVGSFFMRGMCHQCFIWGCSSVPGIRELALVQLFQQISMRTVGIPAPSWKGNATIGDTDLLSICPRPQIEQHPFNCGAKTAMEQENNGGYRSVEPCQVRCFPLFPRDGVLENWRLIMPASWGFAPVIISMLLYADSLISLAPCVGISPSCWNMAVMPINRSRL